MKNGKTALSAAARSKAAGEQLEVSGSCEAMEGGTTGISEPPAS